MAPLELMQETADVVRMIGHPKRRADDCCDPARRPQVGGISLSERTLQENLYQSSMFTRPQFRRAPRRRSHGQPGGSVALNRIPPAHDGARSAAQLPRRFVQRQSPGHQAEAAAPSRFEHLRRSKRTHDECPPLLPHPSLLHYLCRSQYVAFTKTWSRLTRGSNAGRLAAACSSCGNDFRHSVLVLVRPDGPVAWRGSRVPADPASVIDTVRGAGPVSP